MINALITVLTNFVRIYLIYRFIAVFFEETTYNKKVDILVCGIYFVINTGAYFALHLSYVNMICNIIGISMLVLLRTKSVSMYFLVTCSVYLVSMICDCVIVCVFVDYVQGEGFNQTCIIIETFLLYICELLAERIVCHRRKRNDVEKNPLIIIPFICMIVMIILAEMHDEQVVVIVGIGLLVINFLVLYLYDFMTRIFFEKQESVLLQQRLEMEQSYIKVIMQSEDKTKSLKHDLKHHLRELRYLADKKGRDDVLKYIDGMEDFLHNPNEIAESGNVEIDSLLNYMLQQAKRELATVNVNVSIPENILPAFDINMILGNLLENAIEAARQSEEKMLEVLVYYQQGVMTIDIKNSFSGELRKGKNGFLTTKAEKGNHGIGLSSVKQVVEKYDGLMKIEEQDNLFCVNVVLYLS